MDSRVRPYARRAAPRFDVLPSHVQGPGTPRYCEWAVNSRPSVCEESFKLCMIAQAARPDSYSLLCGSSPLSDSLAHTHSPNTHGPARP